MKKPTADAETWPGHVTLAVCALAVAVTVLSWTGKNVDALHLTDQAFFHQPWRLLTSALVHANIKGNGLSVTHLLFNVSMIVQYGRALEQRLGPALTGLFYVLAAVASGALQYALDIPGIGLSGVGYAVFGFLWVASRRDRAYEGTIDFRAIALYVFWFFFCVVASYFDALHIANIAHLAGCIFGVLAGFLATSKGASRLAWGALTLGFAGGAVVLAARYFHVIDIGARFNI